MTVTRSRARALRRFRAAVWAVVFSQSLNLFLTSDDHDPSGDPAPSWWLRDAWAAGHFDAEEADGCDAWVDRR